MAEINIVRKKRSIWGWLILLVLLALIGWAVYKFFYLDRSRYEKNMKPAPTPVGMYLPREEPIYKA